MNKEIYLQYLHSQLDTPFFTVKEDKTSIELTESAKINIDKAHQYLKDKVLNSPDTAFYGINTGFGSLHNIVIPKTELGLLQENLIKSHACGMGDEVDEDIVQIMILLKIQSLCYGNSGVQLSTVQRLVDFYNLDIIPIVFEQGSLGASGDLAPLAHLCLPLIGEGEVHFKGSEITSKELFDQLGWIPLQLEMKEGLALLNGTQFMSAYALYLSFQSDNIIQAANILAALSADAFHCKIDPYLPYIHQIRPHKGQVFVAEQIHQYLKDSPINNQPKHQTQDPYSFRCVPQVHGACYDVIQHFKSVLKIEINSVTDNPNLFPEEDLILSGGNFHGQPLAFILDYLAMSLSEIANISERRVYNLISGQRGLPPFLVKNPGLNSGFMIPQYTAASIVSQSKQYCTPSSVDSIVSSNGQEDHVSMGANAATKALKVCNNTWSVLGIELMTSAQALEFRRPLTSSNSVEKLFGHLRDVGVPFVENDCVMSPFLQKSTRLIKEYTFSKN